MRLPSLALGVAVAMLSLLSPSLAEDSAPPPPAAETQPPPPPSSEQTATVDKPAEDPDEIICKKEAGATETRLKRRTRECRTRREWEQMTDYAQDVLQLAQNAPRPVPDIP